MLLKALCPRIPAGLTKTLRIMKLTAIILLSACLTASAKGDAQGITLSLKNAPLETVFKEIQKQAGFNFVYNNNLVQNAKLVDLEVSQATVEEVLKRCFKNQPLTYSIFDKTIVVKLKDPSTSLRVTEEIPLPPPPIDIKGRVTNENGEPVDGASVTIKGTNRGTTTNADGYFELKGVDENATLVITGVSIETREIKVAGKIDLAINVKIKIVEGEDVIVKTNYWETKQKLNPGNISKVSAKDIEKQPVSNLLATLQANVPGLEITQSTGVPGGNFKVRIRGTNSIDNGNDPLYVIDGVPYISNSMSFSETSGNILGSPLGVGGSSPLNSVNPLDIESIEVLKDADATAIYGSRGANGVILITTKKGKPGKTKVDFNFYTGTGKVAKKMNLLNTQQYLQMRNEAFANDNIIPTAANAPDILLWDTTRYTDWQKELIGGSANYLDAQLTLSGGDKNTRFTIGGGYHKETTVFPGDNADQRVSVHTGISNTSSNNRLKTSLLINYSSNSTDLPNEDLTSRAQTFSPNAPALYDADGNLNWNGWNGSLENPLAYTKRKYEAVANNLVSNLTLSYSLLQGLDVKANLGYTKTILDGTQTIPISSLSPAASQQINRSIFSRSNFQNWIIEPQINWRKEIGKGSFNILGGTTFLEQTTDGLAQFANGFSSESLMKNIAAASTIISATNYYSQYRYNAVFGRINYTLKERYIINITGRRDGSSRFGPGKQFANFGAVGTAWIFSEEKFIQKVLPFLSFGKLRASYGTSGNDQLGDYRYLDTYSPAGSGNYQGTIGLAPQRLHNPDFAWEENKKFETGLELGLMKSRIMLAVSWYRNRSSNQLVALPLSSTTGFTSIQGNFPATVQNTGVEIELTTKNIETNFFTWTTSLNLSIPRNKLVSFPNMESFPAYTNTFVVGQPLSIAKQYHNLGIDPVTGVYKFEDVNADGAFNFSDRQTVRVLGRKFFGGIQNNIQCKGFQLDFLFQFVKQTGFNYSRTFSNAPGTISNQPDFVMGRWQKPGDNAAIQRYTTTGFASTAYGDLLYNSGDAVVDASFIRLKNVSLSWNLPVNSLQKLHIENAKLFVQAQNLITITNYSGLDPETQNSLLPPLKVITGGIRLTL